MAGGGMRVLIALLVLTCASVATAAAEANGTNASVAKPTGNASVFCDDNSTACKTQKKEIADRKEQIHEEVRSPDTGTLVVPKGTNGTVKTRIVTIPMAVNYTWAQANEVAFKKSVLADLSKTLPYLNGRGKVTKYSSAGVTIGVVGDASADLLENLPAMLSNGQLNFTSVANATGKDLKEVTANATNGSVVVDRPVVVNTKPVQKALDLKELRKRKKLVLPENDGMNTTLDNILTRAAMRDVYDPAKDVPDGKTKRERRIEFVTDEIMGLISANLKKATKFDSKNTQAVNELILQTHSPQAPVAKQFLSDLAVAFDKASAPAGSNEL